MLLTFVFVDSYVSSMPNTTRIRGAHSYERNVQEYVCVCMPEHREGERKRGEEKERDGARARDNIVLERKAVEEGRRERNERARWREHATIASLLVALVF